MTQNQTLMLIGAGLAVAYFVHKNENPPDHPMADQLGMYAVRDIHGDHVFPGLQQTTDGDYLHCTQHNCDGVTKVDGGLPDSPWSQSYFGPIAVPASAY
jgi:hypothetical protein